jgi:hypothetical protein
VPRASRLSDAAGSHKVVLNGVLLASPAHSQPQLPEALTLPLRQCTVSHLQKPCSSCGDAYPYLGRDRAPIAATLIAKPLDRRGARSDEWTAARRQATNDQTTGECQQLRKAAWSPAVGRHDGRTEDTATNKRVAAKAYINASVKAPRADDPGSYSEGCAASWHTPGILRLQRECRARPDPRLLSSGTYSSPER